MSKAKTKIKINGNGNSNGRTPLRTPPTPASARPSLEPPPRYLRTGAMPDATSATTGSQVRDNACSSNGRSRCNCAQ